MSVSKQLHGFRSRLRLGAGLVAGVVFAAAAPRAHADAVEGWGDNGLGDLGNGTSGYGTGIPVAALGMGSGVTAISAGGFHTLALKDGVVYAWGANNFGELGNGTRTDSSTPIAVSGLISGITAIAAGEEHNLVVQNGEVLAWGTNLYGQVGNGSSTVIISRPVAVVGLSSGVTAIAGGGQHSLAVRNGAVYAWGLNNVGQLGNGTSGYSSSSNVPVPVSGLTSGVTAIAGGAYFSLAVQNGGVFAWGADNYGELGNGTRIDNVGISIPVPVTGLSSGVTVIAAGGAHSLAVQNGTVYAWGYNGLGQLGNGTRIDSTTPVAVLGLSNIIEVAASDVSSYALSTDGSLWVWGDNNAGELGLGTTGTPPYPTPQHMLAPMGYMFTSISAKTFGNFAVATIAPVPEPAALGAAALLTVALLRRARRA